VREYSRGGPDSELASRLDGILSQIEQWRTAARRGSLADLVWRIYRRTDYPAFVSALPSGQARRANLLKLHDRAIQFEGFVAASGLPSLRRFVEFIEKLQETGQDWAPAEPTSSAGNAVRILSVHKSKGLEFPVVFLAELESRFNLRDLSGDCLADAEDTLGLQIIDRRSNSRLSSLGHQIIAERKRATSLAEEMRILYVAATRAESRLILTASQKLKSCARAVTNGFYVKDGPVPDWLLAGSTNPLDWVLYGFADQKALHEALETGLAEECREHGLFSFTFHGQAEIGELSQFVIALRADRLKGPSKKGRTPDDGGQAGGANTARSEAIDDKLAIIHSSLGWRYRFGDAPQLRAKTSVSELTHRNDEYVVRFGHFRPLDRRPICLEAGGGDAGSRAAEPRVVGSATHLLIAELDLGAGVSSESIEAAKEELVGRGAISAAVAEQIDCGSILGFFQSDLGRLALDLDNKVRREWPFTYALGASEWRSPSDGRQTTDDGGQKAEIGDTAECDTIILQGIIDMLIETGGGLVVIDFKTDQITAGEAGERGEMYREQLETYATAACEILKAESATKHVYFLRPGVAIDL